MSSNLRSRPAAWPSISPPAQSVFEGRSAAWRSPNPPTETQAAVNPGISVKGALASLWTTPFLIVLGYVFVDYGRPQDWLPPLQALRPGMLVQGAGILALLNYHGAELPKIGKYIVAFLVLMAISVPIATNNGRAFQFTKDFAIFLVGAVIPIMTFVRTAEQTAIFFRFWIVINALLAFYGVTHGGRGVGSFLGDENDFCLAVNVALPYSLFMVGATRSKFEKVLLLGFIGLALAAVVTSMSRGGFVGLVTVALAFWWRSPRKIVTLFSVLALVGVLSVTVSEDYWAEMKTIQTADQKGDTGETRLYFWSIGWKMFKDNPIIGVGPANFQYNSYLYEDPEKAAEGFHIWGKAAHSLYFTLLPEEGIVGVVIFVAIIVNGWALRRGINVGYRRLVQTRPEAVTSELKTLYLLSRAADASLLAYLVTGAFISVLYHPHFWLIAAFSVVLRRAFDDQLNQLTAVTSRPAPAARLLPS